MNQATSWFVCRGSCRADGTRRYFGRLKLPGEIRYTRIPLGFSDRRAAQQRMAEIVKEGELVAVGLAVPQAVREAAQRPLLVHLEAFLEDVKSKGRSVVTQKHYRKTLVKLFARCSWRKFGDISGRSFCEWRARSGLKPKFVNDLLGSARTFLRWLERQEPSLVNPLAHVEKARDESAGGYRRALSPEEVTKLLAIAPPRRAWVYLVIIYTGLRRKDLNQVTWAHCKLDGAQPCMALPARATKNRKAATIYLRPELVEMLRAQWVEGTRPGHPVFRGKVPSVAKLHEDLKAAGISTAADLGGRLDWTSTPCERRSGRCCPPRAQRRGSRWKPCVTAI